MVTRLDNGGEVAVHIDDGGITLRTMREPSSSMILRLTRRDATAICMDLHRAATREPNNES
jgi:hypothetical protein